MTDYMHALMAVIGGIVLVACCPPADAARVTSSTGTTAVS